MKESKTFRFSKDALKQRVFVMIKVWSDIDSTEYFSGTAARWR